MGPTMKKILFILCFLGALAFGNELRLRDKLAEAEPGSYIVTEQNKNFTLVHVHDSDSHTIVIEEVTIPAARFARCPMPWREWFESGAPGHTSWIMSKIDLETGAFVETFSFTHQGWINLSEADSFLTTLLNLRFQSIPDERRRRIGNPPGYNKPDCRPIWNPCLTVEGQRFRIPFSAWKTRWPSDGSELARKIVEIYLPYETGDESVPIYPTYFPYWIEVEGKIGSARVRIIDSGTEARSPKATLPLQPPRLIGNGKLDKNGLALTIKSPKYFNDYIIIAEEIDSFGKFFPLPCAHSQNERGEIALFVARDELEKLMTPGASYRFTVSPKEDPSICLETKIALSFIS